MDCRTARMLGFRFLSVIVFAALMSAQNVLAQEAAPTISVTVNKSIVFRLAEKAKRVSVTQPEVADVLVVAPNQLLINGKGVGTTSLIVFDERGNVTNYDLMVVPDVAALRTQLRALMPDEKVEVSTSGSAIVLKGEVSNEVIYDKVLEVAMTYLPPAPPAAAAPATTQAVNIQATKTTLPTSGTAFAGGGQLAFDEEARLSDVARWGDKRGVTGIIDLLRIREVRQIELDVVVAEVALGKLREVGLDFLAAGRRTSINSFLGSNSGFPSRLFNEGVAGGPLEFGDATTAIFNHVSSSFQLSALFRLIQDKDITEVLAQPRLVLKNGRTGGFLSGGEVPVVTETADDIDTEFKPFGIRLDMVPTLTWYDAIDLRVFSEVSEIDPTINVAGVPGFRVRRGVNRVEMKEGESLVISGLLDRRIVKELTKVPLLGDIPILGALFRSTRFRNNESELVFVITPRVVGTMKPGEKPRLPSLEKYDDPDIRQVPLPGTSRDMSTSKKPSSPGATIP